MTNKILGIKEKNSVIAHINNLQQIINRMSTSSMNIKNLVALVVTIVVTVLLSNNLYNDYWWINIIVLVYGILSDSCYLALERIFREQYNKFIDKINSNTLNFKDIYIIKANNTNFEGEKFFKTIKCISSFSVWPYYLMIFVILLLLRYY